MPGLGRAPAALCWFLLCWAAPVVWAASPAPARCEPGLPRRSPEERFPEKVEQALEAAVRAEVEKVPHAGLSVGVQRGTKRWVFAVGLRDLGRHLPATPETTYRLASITKSFTAVAVLQLEAEGKLSLDQEIHELVPYYPPKKWPVTVRQLLGHLGGVPNYASAADGRNLAQLDSRRAIALFAERPLVAQPGTKFVYTTWGYDLLGAAVEHASGERYGEYLEHHLFAPAGMDTAALDDFRTRGPGQAKGYRLRDGRRVPSSRLDVSSRFAGGGTRGSVLDLLAFGQAVLDHRLLDAAHTRRMQTAMTTADGRLTDYGMGFATFPRHGNYLVGHAGGQPETSTLLILLPADGVELALATNLEGQADLLRRLQIRLVEVLLEDGRVRREVWTRDPVDRVEYEALYRIFSYGVGYQRWSEVSGVPLPDRAPLEDAFSRTRALLDRGAIAADPARLRERVRHAHEPEEGSAFLETGVQMARTLQRWKGALALATYARRGPLAFFRDYAAACEALDCPRALRFPALGPELERFSRAWREGELPELERARLDEARDPKRTYDALRTRLEGSAFHPDYSEELLRLAERARRKGQQAEQLAWLRRAVTLQPRTAEPLLALADAQWASAPDEARRLYHQAHEEDPWSDALTPEALKKRARDAKSEVVRREIREVAEALARHAHP